MDAELNRRNTLAGVEAFNAGDLDRYLADYVPRYFTEIPAMSGWVGEDALSRVVFLGFPKVFTDETAQLSAETLGRADLTPAVRRSLVDADWELQEALGSRRTFLAAR